MQANVLYSASKPLSAAGPPPGSDSLVPHYVSGPLTMSPSAGWIGGIIHVTSWLVAVVFAIMVTVEVIEEHSQLSHATNMWSLILLLLSFTILLITIVLHLTGIYVMTPSTTPPWVLLAIQGGVALGFVLDFAQIIQMGTANWYIPNATLTDAEKLQKHEDVNNFLIALLLSKGYIASIISYNIQKAGQ